MVKMSFQRMQCLKNVHVSTQQFTQRTWESERAGLCEHRLLGSSQWKMNSGVVPRNTASSLFCKSLDRFWIGFVVQIESGPWLSDDRHCDNGFCAFAVVCSHGSTWRTISSWELGDVGWPRVSTFCYTFRCDACVYLYNLVFYFKTNNTCAHRGYDLSSYVISMI